MSRHAGNFTAGVLAGAVCLAGGVSFSAMAAGASPPDFAPNPSVGWFAYPASSSRQRTVPDRSGRTRRVGMFPTTSSAFTGRQPTFAMGDPNALDEKRFMAT